MFFSLPLCISCHQNYDLDMCAFLSKPLIDNTIGYFPENLILPHNIVSLIRLLPSGFQNPLDCLCRIHCVIRER